MTTKHAFCMALITAALSITGFSSASARVWKATPQAIARDYSMIIDTKGDGDEAVLMWFVPEMVAPNAPGAATLAAMLHKYVIIIAVRGHVDKTSGTIAFEDINKLEAMDNTKKPLTLIAREDLPPTAIAMLTGVETMFRQSMGALGKGMKMFVFAAGNVNSCANGSLAVPFAGETYTWRTPIPGCP